MVFENDKDLYEFALKTDSIKAAKYQEAFKDILFNYQHNNTPFFSGKDEIKDIQIVDLTKL